MSSPPVVFFSVDGLRPDAILQADTPTMHKMMESGSHCLTARTTMPSITLPCHTSMLRGVDMPRHGITSNTFHPLSRPVPSLIDAAHSGGKRTGFFFNWAELRDLYEPASLDVAFSWNDPHTLESDLLVASEAIRYLKEKPFDLLFVYLGHVDECGHRAGWMSERYLNAAANADRCIGNVLSAYEEIGIEPVALVLSDHGGHGQSHGADMMEDITIPWILTGPGVRTGPLAEGSVRIFDTCPTLASQLGIPLAREWEGRVVEEAFTPLSSSA